MTKLNSSFQLKSVTMNKQNLNRFKLNKIHVRNIIRKCLIIYVFRTTLPTQKLIGEKFGTTLDVEYLLSDIRSHSGVLWAEMRQDLVLFLGRRTLG